MSLKITRSSEKSLGVAPVSTELLLPSLEVFTYSCRVLAQHPFHCLPVSISMH